MLATSPPALKTCRWRERIAKTCLALGARHTGPEHRTARRAGAPKTQGQAASGSSEHLVAAELSPRRLSGVGSAHPDLSVSLHSPDLWAKPAAVLLQ